MRPTKAHLALFAIPIAFAGSTAPAAPASEVVPPQNSAANQYTEAYPTASGDRETQHADDIGVGGGGRRAGTGRGSGKRKLSPAGERALQQRGADGRSVVGLVEATAPATATAEPVGGNGASGAEGGRGSEGGTSAGTDGSDSRDDSPAGNKGPSATSEVLGQMTGSSSSGKLGPLLPLLLIAALAWAAGFPLLRRRIG